MPDDERTQFDSQETTTLAYQRREELRTLVPEAFDADGGFDAEAMKLAIGLDPEREEKRFGLVWPGKEQAAAMVNAPHQFHLYPDPDASIEFGTTKNAFVEADNLAALRLMQNAYQGQVKLIYVDPPYNTGNDFVYKDDFEDGLEAYLSQCEISDEDGKRTKGKSRTEAGRKHSPWLNFMYPRLVLARQLLRRDGAIAVACDDNEIANLRLMMNEIFGEENFAATMVWQGSRKNNSRLMSVSHDYTIVFAKDQAFLAEEEVRWMVRKEGLDEVNAAVQKIVKKYSHDNATATSEIRKWFKTSGVDLDPAVKRYDQIDNNEEKGFLYQEADVSAPNGDGATYDVIHPITGKPVTKPAGGWRFSSPSKFQSLVDQGKIIFGKDEKKSPRLKRYLSEAEYWTQSSVFKQDRMPATNRLSRLMGGSYFDFPKDETVLARIIEAMSENGDIVFDFFGGSGSTAHAVWLQNAQDGKARRFVVCTLPEPVNQKSMAAKSGYKVISQITIDRLRLAGEKVRLDHPDWMGDAGFRVFRLAGSKKETLPATATDLMALLEASSLGSANEGDLDPLIPHYICRFAMEAGFRLDSQLERAGKDIWRISQEDRAAWIAIPRSSGELRERLCATGAKQGDEVILVERAVSDSDVANCSAFFKLTTKRV